MPTKNYVEIFLNGDGTEYRPNDNFIREPITAGSNVSVGIRLIAPFATTDVLDIGFELANGIVTPFFPFRLVGIGTRLVDNDYWNEWEYILPQSILQAVSSRRSVELIATIRNIELTYTSDTYSYRGSFVNSQQLNQILPTGESGWYVGVGVATSRKDLEAWFWDGTSWVNSGVIVYVYESTNNINLQNFIKASIAITLAINPSLISTIDEIDITVTDIVLQRLSILESTILNLDANSTLALEKAEEALLLSNDAIDRANEAITIGENADAKAQTALTNSNTAISVASSAASTATTAYNIATAIDGKAQLALDNSSTAIGTAEGAVVTANEAKAIAQGIDDKAQLALDNSVEAITIANDAVDDIMQFQTDITTRVDQLEEEIANAGTNVYVDNVAQARLDFASDPQLQLNSLANEDTNLQAQITAINTDLSNEITNRITGDANLQTQIDDLENLVGTFGESLIIQETGTLYLHSSGVLTESEPTTTVQMPITLTNTNLSSVINLTYTATEDGTVSGLSTYDFVMFLTNLQSTRIYTIANLTWKIGTTTIASLANFKLGPTNTEWQGKIPIVANQLTTNIPYTAGQIFTLSFQIAKDNIGTATINLESRPTVPTAFIRNGGQTNTANIDDFNGTDIQTQSYRNRSYENDLALKAPIYNANLTGIPTAPTASTATNTTQIASTEFVNNIIKVGINADSFSTFEQFFDNLNDGEFKNYYGRIGTLVQNNLYNLIGYPVLFSNYAFVKIVAFKQTTGAYALEISCYSQYTSLGKATKTIIGTNIGGGANPLTWMDYGWNEYVYIGEFTVPTAAQFVVNKQIILNKGDRIYIDVKFPTDTNFTTNVFDFNPATSPTQIGVPCAYNYSNTAEYSLVNCSYNSENKLQFISPRLINPIANTNTSTTIVVGNIYIERRKTWL